MNDQGEKMRIFAAAMAKVDKQRKQKIASILADISSGDGKKASRAIKSLEQYGDASVIKPIFEVLKSDQLREKNKNELIELLCSIKDTSVIVEVMDILDDGAFESVHSVALSAIWNMKVDFSDYIDDFVLIATNGSFLEALDCLTIIENLEGPFMEENLLECQLHLKNFMESDAPKDEQKMQILQDIAICIKDIDRDLSA